MLAKLMVFGAMIALPGLAQRQDEDIVAAAKKTQTPASVLRMAEAIQKEILSLPEYGVFDDIRFEIRNYAVTLHGAASRPLLKSSVENVVKRVEGVEKVVNEIEVLPLSRVDDQIRARVYAAIYFHPMLSRYNPGRGVPVWLSPARIAAGITNDPPVGFHPIHIVVKNGNVRLTGVVDNAADQQVAFQQANSVAGVFSVENDLHVAQAPSRQKASKSK